MSGHVVYSTIAIIIITFGLNNLPFLAGIALMPFQLALLEWYRKAEFSSDRAGLLVTQDRETSLRTFLKLAGGNAGDDDKIDLEAFVAQAAEYETQGSAWERVWKILNTAFRDHPFNTVRVAELQRWISSGEYDRILAGEYLRRGDEGTKPLGDDFVDAAGYYGRETRQFTDEVGSAINKAREKFSEAFRNVTK